MSSWHFAASTWHFQMHLALSSLRKWPSHADIPTKRRRRSQAHFVNSDANSDLDPISYGKHTGLAQEIFSPLDHGTAHKSEIPKGRLIMRWPLCDLAALEEETAGHSTNTRKSRKKWDSPDMLRTGPARMVCTTDTHYLPAMTNMEG